MDDRPLEPLARDGRTPRITVITPSFNQGAFLEESIRSILLQDHQNIEYFVIDGGSSDSSVEIIRRYAPWLAGWVSEPDDGQADAVNKGFDLATGEYLCWLNSDDVLYQGFLARRVEEFSTRPDTALIYGDVHAGWDRRLCGEICGEPVSYLDMLRTLRVSIPQQSAVWRRSVVDEVGPLDARWRVVLDRDFFIRVARRRGLEYIPGAVGFFRQHETAKSVAEMSAWVDEVPQLYSEFFRRDDLTDVERRLERETMANAHLLCADISRNLRDWPGFLDHLGSALKWKPVHATSAFLRARLAGFGRRLRHRGSSA
jgi:glycosyltransferase involved in cell wall biosynthesis